MKFDDISYDIIVTHPNLGICFRINFLKKMFTGAKNYRSLTGKQVNLETESADVSSTCPGCLRLQLDGEIYRSQSLSAVQVSSFFFAIFSDVFHCNRLELFLVLLPFH